MASGRCEAKELRLTELTHMIERFDGNRRLRFAAIVGADFSVADDAFVTPHSRFDPNPRESDELSRISEKWKPVFR